MNSEQFTVHRSRCKRCAFTLAEVLITIAIIGIVAALTIPPLISSYKKQVVETKLKQFYSSMNQAIKLSEIDNGDKKDWFSSAAGNMLDEEGNAIPNTARQDIWFETYLAPYLKVIKKEITSDGNVFYYFPNSTILRLQKHNNIDWLLYLKSPKECYNDTYMGSCYFAFTFCPPCTDFSFRYAYDKGLVPGSYLWEHADINIVAKDKCKAGGKTGSYNNRSYCTWWMMQNGWKIPDDYFYKF